MLPYIGKFSGSGANPPCGGDFYGLGGKRLPRDFKGEGACYGAEVRRVPEVYYVSFPGLVVARYN